MKIFLIGFMGSGKTTLGKRLANKLGYTFIDMDHVVEDIIGMSIADYFKKNGEDAFRKLENETLKSSSFPPDTVVATGGGAPCYFDNLQWMNENGITVYLSLSPKSLAQRLEHGIQQRPVLQNLKGEALENFISEKLRDREPFYNQAQIVITGKDQTAERVIDIIKKKST